MLTLTPPRAARLGRVLENIRTQSRLPDEVLLTVPRAYARIPLASMTYTALPSAARDPLLIMFHVDRDAGPLTKYLGIAAVANGSDIIVIGDDDMWYGPTFIEDFACAVAGSHTGVVFSSGYDKSCGALGACVMGFRGIGVRAEMLRELPRVIIPPPCFLADDVVVTHYFNIQGFELKKLRTRTKYSIDGAYAWSNESINTIHKRHKYTLNEKCVQALV